MVKVVLVDGILSILLLLLPHLPPPPYQNASKPITTCGTLTPYWGWYNNPLPCSGVGNCSAATNYICTCAAGYAGEDYYYYYHHYYCSLPMSSNAPTPKLLSDKEEAKSPNFSWREPFSKPHRPNL